MTRLRGLGYLCPIALLIAVCVSCGQARTDELGPPADQAQPSPPKVGGCNNEHVEGTCTFLVASRAPSQPSNSPPDTTIYRLHYVLEVEGEDRKIDLNGDHLRIPDDKVEELRDYYRKNSPVPCKAYIVRPPCNPMGTSVGLNLDPPEFATPVRY